MGWGGLGPFLDTVIGTSISTPGSDDPGLSTRSEVVVPRVYGRCRVKPVVLYNRTTSDAWKHYTSLNSATPAYGAPAAVDAVLGICQAGATIQGVWRDQDFAGLQLIGGTWTSNGTAVLDAIQRLGGVKEGAGGYRYWIPSTTSSQWMPGTAIYGTIEVVTAASSPWGSKLSSAGAWTSLTGGSGSTPPAWSYLVGSASEGMAYAGLAHIRFEALTLGQGGAKLPDIQFLVDGVGGGPDCAPGTAIRDVLLNCFGIANATVISDEGPDGNYASSADAYWAAMSDTIKLNCTVKGSSRDILDQLLQAVNCDLVVSGDKIKILPLGDVAVGSYVPIASAYTIGPADLLGGEVLRLDIREGPECYNSQPVKYKDSSKGFEDATYTWRDDFDAAAHGRKPAPPITNTWITTAKHAAWLSQMAVKNYLRNRRKLTFGLLARYQLLEAGDILTVGDGVSIPSVTVRVSSIEEEDNFNLSVEAFEWSGATHPVDLTPDVPPTPVTISQDTSASTAWEQAAGAADLGAITRLIQPGPDNLFPNPTSEIDPPANVDTTTAEWVGRYNAGVGVAANGAWVRRLVTDGSAQYQELQGPTAPCVPGEIFYLEAQQSLRVGANGSTSGYIYIRFLDSAGTSLVVALTSNRGTVGAWAKRSITSAAAPAGTVRVYFGLGIDCTASHPAGEEVWFDSLLARRVTQGPHLSVDALQTSNYSEDGSGNPTAGAKLDHTGTALKVAPGNLQVGTDFLSSSGRLAVFGCVIVESGGYYFLGGGSLNVVSLARIDRGASYGPRYVLRVTISGATATSLIHTISPAKALIGQTNWELPMLMLDSGDTYGVDVGFVGLDGTWFDPAGVNSAFTIQSMGRW